MYCTVYCEKAGLLYYSKLEVGAVIMYKGNAVNVSEVRTKRQQKEDREKISSYRKYCRLDV